MIKTLTIVLLIALSGVSVNSKSFPELKGETPNGDKVTLPADCKGKKTLVGLAYGKKAASQLEAWYEPVYLRFVKGHGLFASSYDINVHFVPMFVGANKAAYEPSMKKIRKSAAPEVLDHIVFFKGNVKDYESPLGLNDKTTPYFFVLDENGVIIHEEKGAFSDEKLAAIEEYFME